MKNEEIELLKSKIAMGGGEKAIAKQHAAGKLTARERINELLDKESFEELDEFEEYEEFEYEETEKLENVLE